jgi:hypothetical protein
MQEQRLVPVELRTGNYTHYLPFKYQGYFTLVTNSDKDKSFSGSLGRHEVAARLHSINASLYQDVRERPFPRAGGGRRLMLRLARTRDGFLHRPIG